jgi:hypothetical protein
VAATHEDEARLKELQVSWGLQEGSPLLVVGRLTGTLRADMPDVYFLSDLTHPAQGYGLAYPEADLGRKSQAFAPPREVELWLSPKSSSIRNSLGYC